ncbi:hypothetical protein JOC86_003967 [Bacillus pakistanensis]|uniref:Uncharacterized protein n=1 Tax=Rossellomorea pakistanensis TaxID=992288 RepID=A0ABS2NHQ3_9BACI|nr:hypothetical protein [Bacillus pakistanensis]
MSKAIDLGYEAHDSCTEKALESQKNSIISYILKKVGVMDEDWEW